jgi:hypothetical protein
MLLFRCKAQPRTYKGTMFSAFRGIYAVKL